jgi:hypothetical protein
MARLLRARSLVMITAFVLAACSGSTSAPQHSPSPIAGALNGGLIAFVSSQGVGVIDPGTGKSAVVAPLPQGGAFRVAGPVWGPAPDVAYPVIYFAIHDDRPPERRTSPGVVPYDWLFRVDPFKGTIEPLAAGADFESEGPIGLVANAHYLATTVGCCSDYQVDVLDLTQRSAQVKILTRPPDQPALFTEGAAPGVDGLIAVRGAATGAWYFLNPSLGVLNAFPLKPGQDDGPIAFSPDGTMAAISLIDHGALIEPVNLAPILPSPPAGSASASPAARPASATPTASPAPPRRVNSKLHHADSLAWSADAKTLAIAIDGGIQLYAAAGKDGDAPVKTYSPAPGVTGVDWSGAIAGHSLAEVKAADNPQKLVDALLTATALPAAADTPANRALTRVYLWAYDSSKPSPIASITDATPAILQKYPPLAAQVNYDHWAPLESWALTGGCTRYRVVVTGSIAPVASTFGLQSNAPCLGASPTPTPS